MRKAASQVYDGLGANGIESRGLCRSFKALLQILSFALCKGKVKTSVSFTSQSYCGSQGNHWDQNALQLKHSKNIVIPTSTQF